MVDIVQEAVSQVGYTSQHQQNALVHRLQIVVDRWWCLPCGWLVDFLSVRFLKAPTQLPRGHSLLGVLVACILYLPQKASVNPSSLVAWLSQVVWECSDPWWFGFYPWFDRLHCTNNSKSIWPIAVLLCRYTHPKHIINVILWWLLLLLLKVTYGSDDTISVDDEADSSFGGVNDSEYLIVWVGVCAFFLFCCPKLLFTSHHCVVAWFVLSAF